MGSRGPRPRGEAAARLGDAPQAPGIVGAGPVAALRGGTAAPKHGPGGARQAPGIKRLGPVAAPRGGKAAAKHCPRGAREEARFEYCGALAPTRGGDGADEERGAAARAVPARVAPPRDVPRFRKVAAGRDPRGRARICRSGAERRAARRAAPLLGRVERRRLHPRRGRGDAAHVQGAADVARHGAFEGEGRPGQRDRGRRLAARLIPLRTWRGRLDGPPRRRGRHGRGRPTYGGPSPPGPTSPSRPCARATSSTRGTD